MYNLTMQKSPFWLNGDFLFLVMRKEEIAYSTQTVYNESKVKNRKGANTPWKDF